MSLLKCAGVGYLPLRSISASHQRWSRRITACLCHYADVEKEFPPLLPVWLREQVDCFIHAVMDLRGYRPVFNPILRWCTQ